jgi:hypothetical protein
MEFQKAKTDTFKSRWQLFFSLTKKRQLLQYYLIDAHLNYSPDPVKYKKDTRRGLITALVYAILFGIYEGLWAFSIFDGFFVKHLYLHWILWWISTIIIAYIATNRRWDQIILSLLIVVNFEDVIFWTVQGIRNNKWPFPAGDWWDTLFASFRVLGNWGTATTFWPYVPRYYYVVLGILLPYYLFAIIGGPKYGQLLSWVLLPVVIPVLIGLITSDFGFIVIFSEFVLFGYGWGIYLILLAQKKKKFKDSS